ncbi:MAG: PD-(D/E)XK nuclease family protein [Treponema sp.]|nr:PD-(D/E)XK nuclease family protein [Treponema sp.]
MTHDEIEEKIRERFELNYEILRSEGGHALTKDAKETALNQILYYYRRMKSIAHRISETELKLTLSDQFTPAGRRFAIEGIVDIVSEQGEVTMYDIKTHDAGYIKANSDMYERQLNVYAYIWEKIRENNLDHTAIISTSLPPGLRSAIYLNSEERINAELEKWDPVIPIAFNEIRVGETIQEFAGVVDNIESHCFQPPPVKTLKEKVEGSNVSFALRVCSNCDGRYSCESYREYALESGIRTAQNFKKYFEDYRDDAEQEHFFAANLAEEGQT